MEKYKNTFRATAVIIILATIYLAYRAIFIGGEIERTRFFALIGVYIIGFLLYKYLLFVKDTTNAGSSILDENNPDKFIKMCGEKAESSSLAHTKQMWIINQSAGYSFKNDYKMVIETLKNVDEKYAGPYKLIYLSNLAYAYFMLDMDDEGKKIVEKYEKKFIKAIKRNENAKEFCLTLAMYYFKKKEYIKSLDFIKNGKNAGGLLYTDERLSVHAAWINALAGKKDEASKELFTVINKSQFPGIKAFAQMVFDNTLY